MDITKFTSKDIDAIFDASQRFSVGFDDLFYRLHSYGVGSPGGQYPPYNIVKESNVKWRIELALAGWAAEDIEVSTESNVLLIKSKTAKDRQEEDYMHRGVATRTFARGFNLSDDVEVGTVSFTNGMLVVELQKIIPDHQKLKIYEIGNPLANTSTDSN
jgi:molecular chaperone IbpA|tara:strand:+ start:1177 stop:1653 length:477 start_codon:yes stop_codon:yes gene_type:complete